MRFLRKLWETLVQFNNDETDFRFLKDREFSVRRGPTRPSSEQRPDFRQPFHF